MAFKLPFSKSQIALILSLILNLLGGTGTVKPFMGASAVDCPPTAEPAGPVSE